MRSRCLGGGLHGTQVAAASRVLLLLDDGGGHGEAGHRLVALHAPGFSLQKRDTYETFWAERIFFLSYI